MGPSPKQVVALPLAEAPTGPLLCPVRKNAALDRLFGDWEAPLVAPERWGMMGLLDVVELPGGRKALRFSLDGEGKSGFSMRYDRALVTREAIPADATITATVAIESGITAPTGDNNVHVRPWIGIVGRMQDVRHYYFLCLEYPDALVLYRREDDQWLALARHGTQPFYRVPHEITLAMTGNRLEGWLDGTRVMDVTDYRYTEGKAGLRASCPSYCTAYKVEATEKAAKHHQASLAAKASEIRALAERLPKPALAKVFDLRSLGNVDGVIFANLAAPGKPPQMLIALAGAEGYTHILQTYDGETIWKGNYPGVGMRFVTTSAHADGHCDLFGHSDEEVMLVDGRSGRVLARRPLPAVPGKDNLIWMFPVPSPVNLDGGPQPREFLLRGTDWFATSKPNYGQDIWALDEGLDILWYLRTPLLYGHSWSFSACDLDGDGREEILAGPQLISAAGEVIWAQWAAHKLLQVPVGEHVDAVNMGFYGGPEERATAHLQSSSAGNIVVDALTGEIIAVHPQGHAQEGCAARYVPGEDGMQVLVACRWCNYGLCSFYTGDGRRLHTFQPCYIGENVASLNWAGDGVELAVIVMDPRRAGAYDHLGRRILDLQPFLPHGAGIYLRSGQVYCQDILGDPRDEIVLHTGGLVHVITQDKPLPTGTRVYAPIRRWHDSYPAWTQA